MKTLIENSIEIKGMGHPDTKTIFNSEDRTHMRFKSLTTISGRKLTVDFKFEENEVESSDKLQMVIPVSNDEMVIKDFILNKINEYLL
jgi:hypothetical protein